MSFFFTLFLLFLLATAISAIVVFFMKRIFSSLKLLDRPHLYKSEGDRPPAPYSLGVVLWITLFLTSPFILSFFDFTPILIERFWIYIVLWLLVTLVSFLDDLDTIGKASFSLPPWLRLAFQILIGAIIWITSIKISYLSNIFGDWMIYLDLYSSTWYIGNTELTIYYIPVFVTIVWYVVVMNALNWSDGIPWLTGGFSLISFLILMGLAVKLYFVDSTLPSQENSRFVLAILMVLLPTTFWLTRLDIARRWLMGDSGTMMLAFSIATLAIIAGWKIATAVSVLGVYLIDAFYVVTVRLLNGKNPMKGDRTHHLHYRLMELGFTPKTTRNFVFLLSFLFWLGAIFLDKVGKIILILLLTVIVIFITRLLAMSEKPKNE